MDYLNQTMVTTAAGNYKEKQIESCISDAKM